MYCWKRVNVFCYCTDTLILLQQSSAAELHIDTAPSMENIQGSLSSKLNTCYGVSFGDPLSPVVDNSE